MQWLSIAGCVDLYYVYLTHKRIFNEFQKSIMFVVLRPFKRVTLESRKENGDGWVTHFTNLYLNSKYYTG